MSEAEIGATLLFFLATPAGLEPATYCLEGSCSIRLSYGAVRRASMHRRNVVSASRGRRG